VPRSLTHLAGLDVGAEDFLAAVLDTVEQPIWVVDPDGLIRFANPAALAALGYDAADELLGCHSHETIHYRRPDGTPYPAEECPMLRPRVTGERVASDLDWFLRRDGSMFPVSYVSAPLAMPEGRGAVVAFTDIEDRLRTERVLREHDAVLAARERSLRRIAALVARGAASAEVFGAIAREVGRVIGLPLVALWRYERDGTATVIGAWGERSHPFHVGTRWPLEGPTICAKVAETGRPARIEDFAGVRGRIAQAARETGIRSCAGAPIIIGGEVWGAMSADSTAGEPLPEHIEDRLAEFTELVATAIANAQARADADRLAEEQAALRRVATLVARESPPDEVFAAVAEEVGRLLRIEDTRMVRYEPDGTATVVASWGRLSAALPVGTRLTLEGESASGLVLRTGRSARIDDFAKATGSFADFVRRLGVRRAVGAPILVSGRLWGAMSTASLQDEPLPPDTEARMLQFAELVATAISNVETRLDLAASRARIVMATDEARRRFERDLHDGAQQRLVSLGLELQHAEALAPAGLEPLRAQLSRIGEGLTGVLDELRELSRGIHPAILSEGGLEAALRAIARRSVVPVRLESRIESPLELGIEVAAYYVVSEALVNTAKHARASAADVRVEARDGVLALAVSDDGVGGADPARGSGLVGLSDRVEALGGTISIVSPEGGGTSVRVQLPVAVPAASWARRA
jgi:PAS domain S-box-containing protein